MKGVLFFILLYFGVMYAWGQDFDVYPRLKDDLMHFDNIPASMRFSEYRLLQRNVRMMDAFSAVVVPGYIHFKAGEKKAGYWLLGLRLAGYAGLTAVYVNGKARGESVVDVNPFDSSESEGQPINIAGDWKVTVNDLVTFFSVGVIFSTYLYDWLHGKAKLESKQELIRYQYGLKMSLEKEKAKGKVVPSVGISVKF